MFALTWEEDGERRRRRRMSIKQTRESRWREKRDKKLCNAPFSVSKLTLPPDPRNVYPLRRKEAGRSSRLFTLVNAGRASNILCHRNELTIRLCSGKNALAFGILNILFFSLPRSGPLLRNSSECAERAIVIQRTKDHGNVGVFAFEGFFASSCFCPIGHYICRWKGRGEVTRGESPITAANGLTSSSSSSRRKNLLRLSEASLFAPGLFSPPPFSDNIPFASFIFVFCPNRVWVLLLSLFCPLYFHKNWIWN